MFLSLRKHDAIWMPYAKSREVFTWRLNCSTIESKWMPIRSLALPSKSGGRSEASEIIAAMLLIVIMVAVAVLMYAYASGLMGRLQGATISQPYLEHVSLDYYNWSSLSTLTLTLRNVGVAKVTMSDFFVAGIRNTTALTFGSGCNSPKGCSSRASILRSHFPSAHCRWRYFW